MGLEDVSEQGKKFEDLHRKNTRERRGGLFFPLVGSTIAGVAFSTLMTILLVAANKDYSAMQTVNKGQQDAAHSIINTTQTLLSGKIEEIGKKEKEMKENAEEKSNLDKLLEQIRKDFKKAQATIETQAKDIEVKATRITDLELEATRLSENLKEAQKKYQTLNTEYGKLEVAMIQLREINTKLEERLDKSSEKEKRLAALDKVFIEYSDRYFSLIKIAANADVDELKRLRAVVEFSRKGFSDLNTRNLKTLIESIDAIVGMQTEVEKRKNYETDWKALASAVRTFTDLLQDSTGKREESLKTIELYISKIKEIYDGEHSFRKNEEQVKLLGDFITGVGYIRDLESELKDLNKRYATLEDADKDKAKLAEQITGLTSDLEKKTKEVEAKAKEAQGYLDSLETLRTSSKKLEEERENAWIRLAAEEKRATDNEKKYEQAEADRKKAVIRLDVMLSSLANQFKTYETVWSGRVKEKKGMPFNMVAVAALAAELASKKMGNEKESAVYNQFISLIGKMEEAYKDIGVTHAYLGKRLTDLRKEYDTVLVNGMTRGVRDGEGMVIHFDMTYDHKPDEEKLMRIGDKFSIELAKKLGLIEMLTDYPDQDKSPEERLKERLEKIAQREEHLKKKFKHFYVGFCLENADSIAPYYLAEVYEGDSPDLIRGYSSKKNVANFIRKVIMEK